MKLNTLSPAPPSFVIILNVILISLIFLIILRSNLSLRSTIPALFSSFAPALEEAATPQPGAKGRVTPPSSLLTGSAQPPAPITVGKSQIQPLSPPPASCRELLVPLDYTSMVPVARGAPAAHRLLLLHVCTRAAGPNPRVKKEAVGRAQKTKLKVYTLCPGLRLI